MVLLNRLKIRKDKYYSGMPRVNEKQNEIFIGSFNEKRVNVD